jgi:hypothetical protein
MGGIRSIGSEGQQEQQRRRRQVPLTHQCRHRQRCLRGLQLKRERVHYNHQER